MPLPQLADTERGMISIRCALSVGFLILCIESAAYAGSETPCDYKTELSALVREARGDGLS